MTVFALAGALAALPAGAHESKRIDRCGCHHQYGLRHCHPKKKTDHCEAAAKGEAPTKRPPAAKKAKAKVVET